MSAFKIAIIAVVAVAVVKFIMGMVPGLSGLAAYL